MNVIYTRRTGITTIIIVLYIKGAITIIVFYVALCIIACGTKPAKNSGLRQHWWNERPVRYNAVQRRREGCRLPMRPICEVRIGKLRVCDPSRFLFLWVRILRTKGSPRASRPRILDWVESCYATRPYIYIICIYIYIYREREMWHIYIYINNVYVWQCVYIYICIHSWLPELRYGAMRWPRQAVEVVSGTPSPPIKSLDFRGFDSSKLLILRGGNSHVRIIL